jgi:hypothetical protein
VEYLASAVLVAVGAAWTAHGWIRYRGRWLEVLRSPREPRWLSEQAMPDHRAAGNELLAAGYRPIAGILHPPLLDLGSLVAVWNRTEPPGYALMHLASRPGAGPPRIELVTFFQGDGLVLTTGVPGRGVVACRPGAGVDVPCLVQCRPGSRVTPLEGQHFGSVAAWRRGGRLAMPAERGLLCLQLEAQRLRANGTAELGWRSLPRYLRGNISREPGVLYF